MPTDRVLIEIVTAANMAGIEQAKAGMLGMNVATLGLAAGLGLLVMGGKSMIENSRAFEDAQLSLKQALGGSDDKLKAMQATFDTWAEANKRYIPSQNEAERALANFTRAGANSKVAMRELNDALDLSILKGVPMAEAQQMITLALAGNTRGLKFLGITTAEVTKITHSHMTAAQKQAAILALVEQKTKDGRKAQDDLKQTSNELNADWQKLSKEGGPVLTTAMDWLAKAGLAIYGAFDSIGKNDQLWSNISDRLVNMAKWIHDWVIKPIQDLYALINGGPGSRQQAASDIASKVGPKGARASGGSVSAGSTYTVGEQGPETLVMGSQSGTIIPNGNSAGRSTSIHIHIDRGAYIDGPGIDMLTTKIAQRLRFTAGI